MYEGVALTNYALLRIKIMQIENAIFNLHNFTFFISYLTDLMKVKFIYFLF